MKILRKKIPYSLLVCHLQVCEGNKRVPKWPGDTAIRTTLGVTTGALFNLNCL